MSDESEIERLNLELDMAKQEVAGLEDEVFSLEQEIDSLESDVDSLEKDLALMKENEHRLDCVETMMRKWRKKYEDLLAETQKQRQSVHVMS